MRERADHSLSAANLVLGAVAVLAPAERLAVRQAVIADPVALGASALGAGAAAGVAQLLSDYEEGRAHSRGAEHVEDVPGHLGIGTVVEAERDFHFTSLRRSLAWAPLRLLFLFHRGAATLERARTALGDNYLRSAFAADVNFS